jgi:hypothetical protein
LPSVSSIQPDSRFFGLFIGRSGSGKSAAAYSFPHDSEGGNLEVADMDGRIRGGLVPWINRENFNYTYFPPKPKEGTTFEALNKYFEAMQIMLGHGQQHIQTFVLDSGTWAAQDLLLDAMPLTHDKSKKDREGGGRNIGTMQMAGPSDYGFQSTGMLQIVAFLRSIPIKNVIVTAHIQNRWGRQKNAEGKILDPYGPTEIVGEQLAGFTDKLSETFPSCFDHIFRFEKEDRNGLKFYFEAQGELARTPYPIPYGRIDVTGKDFYQELMKFVKKPEPQVQSQVQPIR